MMMGVVDTWVAGRIGTEVLAGVGLGSTLFWHSMVFFMGGLMALDTFFSQSFGAGDARRLNHYLGQSFWFCLIAVVGSGTVVIAATLGYLRWGPDGAATREFAVYVQHVIWSLPTIFAAFVLQRYWQARHIALPFTLMIILANITNLLTNLALGFGWWGFPEMGTKGIALATTINRTFFLVMVVGYTIWKLDAVRIRLPRPNPATLKAFLRLGIPAGGHSFFEVTLFTIVTFAAATFGATSLAAHHVSLTLAAFTYMFALGISSAAAVRVGYHTGAGRPQLARYAGWICIGLAAVCMGGFALVYIGFRETLMGWFSTDPEVIALGSGLLLIAAIFQISDGVQVSSTGALRGLGNTRAPMIANFVGYFIVGLPVGFVCAYRLDLGVRGLWTGLAIGLGCVAVALIWLWWRSGQPARQPVAARPD